MSVILRAETQERRKTHEKGKAARIAKDFRHLITLMNEVNVGVTEDIIHCELECMDGMSLSSVRELKEILNKII